MISWLLQICVVEADWDNTSEASVSWRGMAILDRFGGCFSLHK